ncbi:MAG: hypothetical protein ACRDLT_15030 [Solirubrobacteraceae bacterium]
MTGTLTSRGAYSFTLQTPGKASGVLAALTTAANKITAEDYPYVWGGGHGQAGIASVGEKGPGHNGKRRGYDCSGSVAAVLAGAGLWPAGAGVPNDAGVIRYLRQQGAIEPRAGGGLGAVTLYDDPGVHIFMNINGRFFGTSDGGGGGDRKGGPGWLDDSAWDAHSSRFRRYHFVPSVLKATTDAGYTLAFQFGADVDLPTSLPAGIKLRVVYKTTNQGTMVAQSVTPVGELTATGTVTTIAAGGTSFTIHRDSGPMLTLPATGQLTQTLLDGQLAVGDSVSVTYLTKPQRLVLALTVTAIPATPTTTAPTTTTPTTTTTTPTTTTPTTTTPTTTAPITTTSTTTTTTITPTTTDPATTDPGTTGSGTTGSGSGGYGGGGVGWGGGSGGGWGGSGGAGF